MPLIDSVRNSKALRWPLLAAAKILLSPLKAGPKILRRAAYDAMPLSYLVTGHPEQFVVSTSDKTIGRQLFLHGEFDFWKLESALAILEQENLHRPKHLIDVGANIGTIVIPALKRGLMQSATAIEPHPNNLRLLRANLALNDVSHDVEVFAIAAGNEAGRILQLQESATNSGNHSIGTNGISVHSERLDDLGIHAHDALLWMDIEGYEGHALDGASGLLSTGIPVVCEYNPTFLEQSGGMSMLRSALNGRRIFDLNVEIPIETTLDEISAHYAADFDYTDILAIPGNGAGKT